MGVVSRERRERAGSRESGGESGSNTPPPPVPRPSPPAAAGSYYALSESERPACTKRSRLTSSFGASARAWSTSWADQRTPTTSTSFLQGFSWRSTTFKCGFEQKMREATIIARKVELTEATPRTLPSLRCSPRAWNQGPNRRATGVSEAILGVIWVICSLSLVACSRRAVVRDSDHRRDERARQGATRRRARALEFAATSHPQGCGADCHDLREPPLPVADLGFDFLSTEPGTWSQGVV